MKLEIKIMWCKGLTAFNFFQKLSPYIVVSIHAVDERLVLSESQKQEQKTHVDNDGDGNPEWHYTMHFNLDKTILTNLCKYFLLFEIKNHGSILMGKNIGDVKVPLHDLVHSVGHGVVRFASYEVRNLDAKSNGVLDFSYKVMGKVCVDHDYHHPAQSGPLNLDRVEIDGYGGNGVPSAPPLFGGEENGRYQGYPPSVYAPPGPAAMWTPPPPPPPRPQPVAYRPPPEEYYNQHSGSESGCGYHGYSHRPPPEEYYNQHSGSEGSCGYHGYDHRPPLQEYYNQHSGSESSCGYHSYDHRPPLQEYYNQHSGSEGSCGYHGYDHRPPLQEYYNHHSGSGSGCGYDGYSYRPPPAAPAPAAGEHYYYHQHSNSGGGYGFYPW